MADLIAINPAEQLPSATSALAFVRREPGAWRQVAAHTAGRAALIGVGLTLAGQRRGVMKGAIAGALAIEAFVLWWAYKANQASNAQQTTTTTPIQPR